MTASPAEPPWYGPVCPVVWEGRHREVPPYPDQLPQGPSVCDKIAASSDCSRPVNDYVHIEAADLCRPNARFTQERQGYQVLTPFEKLGYSQKSTRLDGPAVHSLSRRAEKASLTQVRTTSERVTAPRVYSPLNPA